MIDWTPDPMEFTEGGPAGASIWLSSRAIAGMVEAAVKAGRCETGGILIGCYGADRWNADIVEATPRPRGSLSGWFWFQRSKHGLASLLEDRWRLGFHYLGEWHFHPGGAPTPSGPDIRAMRRIASDEVYRCPSPILVILGGQPKTRWSISATLFRDGHDISLEGKPVG
ncbi:Mov34/MPN/PAD-1 family protein [Mesorhizobium sp. ES1-6]|uniref:Mov34/MPN/PAD-1 family protein n=1 Tax=Mesorhizobium sp. ES1-6 TaxID=2876626 RepID=UPI001CCDF4FC|nr:Mov34/MPN/PAD-1 family protein [Mesorhizobium sp. ES1-6]MBZ9801102.1 Mov34/MPN/PAD-1 family protein [Mesorhizobium sp. ES1-6]